MATSANSTTPPATPWSALFQPSAAELLSITIKKDGASEKISAAPGHSSIDRPLRDVTFESIHFDIGNTWSKSTRQYQTDTLTVTDVKFLRCTFDSKTRFEYIHFVDVIFQDCIWNACVFADCHFENCSFVGVSKSGVQVLQARFESCKFSKELKLTGMDVSVVQINRATVAGGFKIAKPEKVLANSSGVNPFALMTAVYQNNKYKDIATQAINELSYDRVASANQMEIGGAKNHLDGNEEVKQVNSDCSQLFDFRVMGNSTVLDIAYEKIGETDTFNRLKNLLDDEMKRTRLAFEEAARKLVMGNRFLYASFCGLLIALGLNFYSSNDSTMDELTKKLALIPEHLVSIKKSYTEISKIMRDEELAMLVEKNKLQNNLNDNFFNKLSAELRPAVAQELSKNANLFGVNINAQATQSSKASDQTVAQVSKNTQSSLQSRLIEASDYGFNRTVVEISNRLLGWAEMRATGNAISRATVCFTLLLLTVTASRYSLKASRRYSRLQEELVRLGAASVAIKLAYSTQSKQLLAKTIVDFSQHFMPPQADRAEDRDGEPAEKGSGSAFDGMRKLLLGS